MCAAKPVNGMASPIGSHGTFNVKTDRRGSTVPVHISEQAGARAENLSLSTWGASFVLANVLHELAVSLPKGNEAPASGTHVLELGAGTGLVGLTAAMLWKMPTLLTDLSPLLPALAGNVLLNKALLARQSVSCASLDWSKPDQIQLFDSKQSDTRIVSPRQMKAHVILAADTIYSEEHPELLTKTILTWLAPHPDARVIVCYPLRMACACIPPDPCLRTCKTSANQLHVDSQT